VLLALVVLASPSDTYAGSFEPTLEVTVVDPTPEAASEFRAQFGITVEHVNFAAVVSYIPPSWGIVPGEDIPIGADVGTLDAQATLGLVNSACYQVLPVHFDFKNSSIDLDDTVSFDDVDDNGTNDFAELDENGEYMSVGHYPDFLKRVLDNEETGEPLQPIRRSSGVAIVAAIPVLLQFLIFPPGTEIDPDLPSSEDYGYPSVTVLQNAGDPDIVPTPSPITDFCSPLTTENVTFGQTDDGTQLFVNPQGGVHEFTTVSFGQRDADNDGFENSLDTCPYDPNEGTPKQALTGDLDDDGLDAACDPNDDQATGGKDTDEDADGYLNRQDNCPLDANGENETGDDGNQKDSDTDQIGDACDNDPENPDGELQYKELTAEVDLGEGTGDPPSEAACPNCYRGGDGGGNGGGGTTGDDDGGSSNTGLIVGIVAAVIAAVVIIGGGAALMMRRRNGA
jgi:hypothetical protein